MSGGEIEDLRILETLKKLNQVQFVTFACAKLVPFECGRLLTGKS